MTDHKQALARRTWLGGAATAGAAAVAAAVAAVGAQDHGPGRAPSTGPTAEPDGYQLTEHVKQYYASARV